jgi:adenosylhomocysteine nucleosidase
LSGRTAVIVALPREVAALVSGWRVHKEHHHRGIYVWSKGDAVVVAAGMGAARATLAVEAALASGPIAHVVSAGLAGACDPKVGVGSVLHAGEVVDVRSGERFRIADAGDAVLVTGTSIASVREKARLYASYRAAAVDMEAATVARLAVANGMGFRAVKAISDDYTFELGSMDRFTTRHGHFHTRAFALHTAVRPHTWAKTMRLGKHSGVALRALSVELARMLEP